MDVVARQLQPERVRGLLVDGTQVHRLTHSCESSEERFAVPCSKTGGRARQGQPLAVGPGGCQLGFTYQLHEPPGA